MTHNKIQGTESHNKRKSSEVYNATQTKGTDRGGAVSTKKLHGLRTEEKNFHLVVDRVPYFIRSIPVLFNDELRFRVIINGNTEHLFTWDSQIKMLRAIDDDSFDLPDRLEEAISQKLQSQLK